MNFHELRFLVGFALVNGLTNIGYKMRSQRGRLYHDVNNLTDRYLLLPVQNIIIGSTHYASEKLNFEVISRGTF